MCTSIWIAAEGVAIENMGELLAYAGRDKIKLHDSSHGEIVMNGDLCLCPVDIPATAAALGYTADKQHGGDPMEYHWTRPLSPSPKD